MYREDQEWERALLPGFMGIMSLPNAAPVASKGPGGMSEEEIQRIQEMARLGLNPDGSPLANRFNAVTGGGSGGAPQFKSTQDKSNWLWNKQMQDAALFTREQLQDPKIAAAMQEFYKSNRQSDQEGATLLGGLPAEIANFLKLNGYTGPMAWDGALDADYQAAAPQIKLPENMGLSFDESGNMVYTPPTPEEQAALDAENKGWFDRFTDHHNNWFSNGKSATPLQDWLKANGLTYQSGVHQGQGASQWTQIHRLVDANGNPVAVDAHTNRRGANDRTTNAMQLIGAAMMAYGAPGIVGATSKMGAGAASGAAASGSMSFMNGGDAKDILLAMAKGGLGGAAGAGLMDAAGGAYTGIVDALPEGIGNAIYDAEAAIRNGIGSAGNWASSVTDALGAAGKVINDSGALSPVTVTGSINAGLGAGAGAVAGGLVGLAASQVGALSGASGAAGSSGIDQLEKVEVTGPKGGQPDPWTDALTGAMPGLVSTPVAPPSPGEVSQLPKVEVTGPTAPQPDPWEALLDAIGGAGGAAAQPPATVAPAPVAPDLTLPTETITGPGDPAPNPVVDSLIPGLGGALAGAPDLTLPKETITGPRKDDDPIMTIMPVAPPTPPVDANLDKVTVTGPKQPPKQEDDFTIPGVVDRIDTPKIPGQLPNDIPPTDAAVPPGGKPDWSKIIGDIAKGGGALVGGSLKPILDNYNFQKADAEVDRSWADYQSWAKRTTGAMDSLGDLMKGFEGEMKGYQDGEHNTFDKVGSFKPPELKFTRTEDPTMTDFGKLRSSLAGSISAGSSGTGALMADWNQQKARSGAAQADVAAMREGVKKGVEALDPLKIYGENDVRRLSDQSYNNKVGAVDRALTTSASEGFARALSRGVSNSTIAADTRDNVVRRFADTYGQLRDGSDRTAMSEVRGLSDMQNSQRGQQISELEKRFDVRSALQGLQLADAAAANSMNAYGQSASQDASRQLQASTAEANLAQALKRDMDQNLWKAADKQDERDLKLFDASYKGAKDTFDNNWKTADTIFKAGNDRMNTLTGALNTGYGRIADTAKDVANTAGRNYQANMTARGQALSALTGSLGNVLGGSQGVSSGIGSIWDAINGIGGIVGGKGGSGEFDWDWGSVGDWLGDWLKPKPKG